MNVRLLVLTAGKWQGKLIPISRFPFLIGRDSACQLRPASPLVSNRHCAIIVKEGRLLIHDLGSTNGTLLNDMPIAGEMPLTNGDWLRVGPLDFDVAVDSGVPIDRPTPLPPTKRTTPVGDDSELATLLKALREEDVPPAERELSAAGEEVPTGRTAMDIDLRELVEWEEVGPAVAIHFTDPKILDDRKIQMIGEQLNGLIQGADKPKLLLNLANVRAMSSTMAEQLAGFSKKVRAQGGRLIVCNILPSVFPVFQHLKLTKTLAIHADEQEALQALR
jgi:anti-anti-sigma factor